MQEILSHLREEYSLTPQQMLQKVKGKIADASLDDLERWRAAGQLQYRMIDGQVGYFRREPSNLLRFCDEAKTRCGNPSASDASFVLTDHLAKVIDEAKRTGQTEVAPIRHRIKYQLTVPANVAGAKKGSLLRVWLPFPQEYRQQRDVKLINSSPAEPKSRRSASKNGRILPTRSGPLISRNASTIRPSQMSSRSPLSMPHTPTTQSFAMKSQAAAGQFR